MAKLPVYPGRNAFNVAQATTNYAILASTELFITATESWTQSVCRTPGTFSDMTWRLSTNTISATPSASVTFRKNGADGTQALSFASATTGEVRDVTHSDAVAIADLYNFKLVTGAFAAAGIAVVVGGCAFAANANTVLKQGTLFGVTPSTASTKFFIKYGGQSVPAWATPETAAMQYPFIAVGGTIKNSSIQSATTSRTTATAFAFNINGAPGTVAMSVGAGVTGNIEDTTHTEVVAANDLISRTCTNGASADTGILGGSLNDFETTDATMQFINALANETCNAASTIYEPVTGKQSGGSTTEATTQTLADVALTLSGYKAYISANTITGTSNIVPRKNAATVTGIISITGNGTGWFSDTTHSDVMVASDEMNYQVNGGTGGTSMTIQYIAALARMAVTATAARRRRR